ncbi:hypothetical protein [Halorubellus sp. PRR65]|uniref:DUF7344 domain-containing protein n=1 Tax=Halorubellus sp. PRR65 TaxID=3098148 RepID=UPI002B25BB40|nr:hypothetical protein [Halorubellus sp. PRR65]
MSTESQSTSAPDEGTSVTEQVKASERLETEALAEPETELELDQVFEILKNQRRRYVLQYLNDVDDTVSMSDLAEEIAALENGKEVSQLSSSERKRVYVGLYQCHLPKMDSMGVVSFNKPRGLIEPGPNAEVFDEYLETDAETDGPAWHRIHALTAGASAVALLAAVLVQAFVTAPVVVLAGLLIVAANVGCSAAHYQWVRSNGEDDGDGVGMSIGGASST